MQRKPLALMKGHKLTKAQREERRAVEEFLECPTTEFDTPAYITEKRDKERFDELRAMISAVDSRLMTALDADQLARYVISERCYIEYTKQLRKAIRTGDMDLCRKAQIQQDTAFKQVQSCASALGMNITSRLKFDVPKPAPKEEDDFERFE